MTENLPATPSPQAIAAKDRSEPKRITGKLKAAIDRMVWFGDKRADAATAACMTDHGLRSALRKPHVLAFYRRELAALREGERARNVHRLVELRDQDENRNAAVKAVQVLEQTDPEIMRRAGDGTSPGIVIRIIEPAAQPLPLNPKTIVIEHEPTPSGTRSGELDGEADDTE